MRKSVRCFRCGCKIDLGYNGFHESYSLQFDGDEEIYLCESCNGKLTFGQDDLINLYRPLEGEK